MGAAYGLPVLSALRGAAGAMFALRRTDSIACIVLANSVTAARRGKLARYLPDFPENKNFIVDSK